MARDGKMVLRGFRQLAFYKQLTDTVSGRTYDNPMLAEAPISISGQENMLSDALPAADDDPGSPAGGARPGCAPRRA